MASSAQLVPSSISGFGGWHILDSPVNHAGELAFSKWLFYIIKCITNCSTKKYEIHPISSMTSRMMLSITKLTNQKNVQKKWRVMWSSRKIFQVQCGPSHGWGLDCYSLLAQLYLRAIRKRKQLQTNITPGTLWYSNSLRMGNSPS